jgi:hypothetical protein
VRSLSYSEVAFGDEGVRMGYAPGSPCESKL